MEGRELKLHRLTVVKKLRKLGGRRSVKLVENVSDCMFDTRIRTALSYTILFISDRIDDLRKSRGLHSVSIYRSMPAGVVQSRHAFVGGTVSTWAR